MFDQLQMTLKPYLSLIKIILIVGLVCGGYVTGCSRGEANKQAENTKLHADLTVALDANHAWVTANEEANKQTLANKKEADRQKALAEAKAGELAAFRKRTDDKMGKLQDKLEQAMKEPECTELLKAHFCSAVPLPLRP